MGTAVSDSNKFIFIHIPKTAGTSIASITDPFRRNKLVDKKIFRSGLNLLSVYVGRSVERGFRGRIIPEHASIEVVLNLDSKINLDDYFKFAVVRNPWDRVVSMYNYHLHHSRSRLLRPGYWKSKGMSFDRWLEDIHCPRRASGVLKSQFDMVKHPGTNENCMDAILKFESLSDDFRSISEKIGICDPNLPTLNQSMRGDYRAWYTDKAAELVSAAYFEDIQRFGYSF